MSAGSRTRPRDWTPLRDSDPVPGDAEEIRDEVRHMTRLAEQLREQSKLLQGISNDNELRGKYANRLRSEGGDLQKKLGEVAGRYERVHGHLSGWANALEDFQSEADRILRRAKEKQQEVEADQKKKEHAGSGGGKDGGPTPTPSPSPSGVEDDPMLEFHRQLMAVESDRDERARYFGDRIKDELDDVLEDSTWENIKDWTHEHADLFKSIGDVLSNITAVLGVLAIITMPFPPLGVIFGALALAGSALTLGAQLMAKAGGADVGWGTIGLTAVGLIPGIGAFGKGAKFASMAKAGKSASALGKGFKTVKLTGQKNLFAMGGLAGKVEGGVGLVGRKLVLGGTFGKGAGMAVHESSTAMSKLGAVVGAGYHEGQMLGTKGANMLFGKGGEIIDPMSDAGRVMDASFKMAPKMINPVTEGVQNLGDQFGLTS
ncbi:MULTISPECIES: hypothetical protein [unclassified Streptomyces]|uniref:hypothetical protein n=1 Tax=unclassified Streptomyces TaxID=2593676 RepID=UPI00278C2FE0|nr:MULTISPECIES: hypothetical protein [unclassified Streptomyces]